MRHLLFLVFLISFCYLHAQNDSQNTTFSSSHREKVIINHLSQLQSAKTAGTRNQFGITLPINGKEMAFFATPNDVIDDEFRRKYPDILTYDLTSKEGGVTKGALTLSPVGLFATILGFGKMISIYPEDINNPEYHMVEYGIAPDVPRPAQFCGHDHTNDDQIRNNVKGFGSRANFKVGDKRYNYRVAIVTTGEFYVANGNNDVAVISVVTNSVNGISAIFNNDMSFKISLGSRVFLYKDPNTDPFIPNEGTGEERTIQAGKQVPLVFPSNTFDIGHVFHQHKDGDDWGNGGIALLQSVCDNATNPSGKLSKASAWSGAYSNNGNGWIQLATHEFGHQFGANHTFNGIGSSCTDAIAESNSYEIGSGTTIMSYNGICDAGQNITASDVLDNYFHTKSQEEMFNYVYNGEGGTCGSPVNSNNAIPLVDGNPCNARTTIPKGTPFYMKAAGVIGDTDTHTYCWEQIDEDGANIAPTQGFIGAAAANTPNAPLFRSYPPSISSERYFPRLSVLAANTFDDFDVLSNVARSININITIRDNNTLGGSATNDNVQITVANSGPFVISRPNGGETFTAGMNDVITWNTGGSNSLCNNVRIKMSVDGGLTYPVLLAENVPYAAGTYNFAVPSGLTNTNTARILIECMDFECFKFFNISKTNFSINSTCVAPNTVIKPLTNVTLDQGDPGLKLNLMSNVGNKVTNFAGTITTTDIKGNLIFFNGTPATCEGPSNTNYNDIIFFSVDVSGSYTIAHGGPFGTVMNLYAQGFTIGSCDSHISSSAERPTGTGTISVNGTLTANLVANTSYFLVVSSFSFTTPATIPFNYNVTFPTKPNGANIYNGVILPAEYSYTYVAVNTSTNQVAATSATSDFTTLDGGTYCVYGIAYLSTTNISNWIGKTLSQILLSGDCFLQSDECKPLEIKSACTISNIVIGSQGQCQASTNFYTQNITVTYDKAPSTGMLSINGQQFTITSSPQMITLINLNSDGLPVDVNAFFTASPNCKITKTSLFTAPPGCCPVILDLGPDQGKCVGETIVLNGGEDGISYVWKKDGVVITGQTQKTLSAISSGLYEVEVTHSSGCKKSDKVVVTFNPLPTVVLPATGQICQGETLTLTPNIVGSASVKWFKNNIEIPGETANTLTINGAGSYKAVATSALGCPGEDEIIVSSINAPVVELGADLNKCEGEAVTLSAGADGVKYTWFRDGVIITGETQNTYKPLQSGIYRVLVENAATCKSEDQVSVKFFASPVVSSLPATINACQGIATDLSVTASDYQTLQWFFNSNPIPGSTGLTFSASNSGKYSIIATNNIGCKTERATQIDVKSLPVVNFGSDVTACIGATVELNAGSEGTTYIWKKDNLTLSNTTNKIQVTESGKYNVTVTNSFNCSSTAEKTVTFIQGPTVSLNGDKTICEGDNWSIIVTTSASNATYRWSKDGVTLTDETQSNLSVTTSGTYVAFVTGGTPACEVNQSVKITVNPKPAFNLGNDKTLCEGDTYPILDGGAGNTSYEWKLNNQDLATTRTVNANKTGTYSVKVKNSFGCERTEQVKITIEPLPTLVLNNQYNLCQGKTLDIVAESNGTKFEWKKGTVVIPNQTSKTLKVDAAGTYTLVASNAANCKKEVTFTVTSRANPTFDLGVDETLCPGNSKTLNAGAFTSYEWSNGTSASSLVINAGSPATITSTKYVVTVTNEFGCTNKDSINITLNPVVKANITADKPGVCNGDPVILTATGGVNYLWIDPNNTLSTLIGNVTTANPTETTTYTVEVSDALCPDSKDSKTIEIKVFEPIDVSAGRDTSVIIGRTIKLNAKGGVSYDWDNKSLIVGPSNISNPVVKPEVETIFTVTIIDKNGCEFTDDVKVSIIEDPLALFKPVSIITPNGDGANDELVFVGLESFPENSLKIFNRWGGLIFESEGYQNRGALFDGRRNGDRLPADTYYYVLIFEDQVIKSSLTILWD